MFHSQMENESQYPIREQILNPNQRQQLEDNRRIKEQMQQLQNDDASPTHLYVPKLKVQADVNLLDEHDSFYHTTKSLLVLFQIMGVMPIMRSPKGVNMPRTTFTWCSKAFLWAYFIYACETVVVVIVAKERINRFITNSDKRFDEVIYNIIFMSILLPHFLLPVASWRNGSEVAKFKNMWTDYQYKYLVVTGKPITFPKLYPITWALCVVSWTLGIAIIMSQYYLQPDFKFTHTFAYYHILAMLNGFCSLWFVNCTAFGTASKAFAKQLSDLLATERSATKLTEYRYLWIDLSHMMQQLGKAYSNMYGIYCLVIFFTTIIATYGSLSEIIEHGATYKEVGLFVIVFYCMGLLFIICNEAHHASKRVGLNFQERLLNVNLTAVDKATQKEVEMFLLAIDKNPPTMNLDGYANINRGLITSNISFMATYLIVLMQFKLTLLRQGAKKALISALKANATAPE
ncbi:gustatory and odorant receptor 22 isoform X2 [Toxorhynchites rutilus septentrionalis]|uniref:gustatory and odorant receptor 22 isoform X2 n=1 Tax=Toxorhynchites rutilus septentrionalis TaxID=329112 RepID=UPI0024796D31|nr:gustatory and odorant receptor 22 isoform X2 [Toxorhynchites rutilus septentrionalis]